ncbi:MAG: universal stress protein [Bacteroidia bacterium]|nr:universal stress protein [Bacteroidia bacterium]NNF30852.1 universal stress protein [Flavobacteriaceae bacterium]MBT8275441.1 universal stress protein [Bacteroidia bacterium]NNJ82529.1 universal stress protein [Flavobacteriaceae bacterium]NNK54465.1 universal stress protein [Flavobacteriaceae bacterium]
MKNILLPTDFSQNSYHAMDYAMKYFTGTKINFVVLNIQKSSEYIMDDLMTASPGTSVHEAISGDNTEKLRELVDRYKENYADEDFSFESIFDFDVFIDAIAQTVVSRKIDLIVMGTNGASGAREAVFGSNTLQVIRSIKCPVLAIPEDYRFQSPEKVMLTVIKERYPSSNAIQSLQQLFQLHDLQLHVVHITDNTITDRGTGEAEISKLFPKTNISHHYLEDIPVPMAISSFTQLMKVDMHCILVEQKSFLDRFIHGSDTSRISYSTEVPLLVIHN